MLKLENISKTFDAGSPQEQTLFQNFSLEIPDGQFVSIVGSNGSGKTTLLNLICGTAVQDSGTILLNGRDISHQKSYLRSACIGRVYQAPSAGTAPNLTVLENLSLADCKGQSFGLSRAVQKNRLEVYREELRKLDLGLEEKLHVKMGALSGGQRQAVSLLMATMTPIQFLILDEHTAALDPKTAQSIMDLTNRIVRKKHLTAMMVTHNLRFALEYGDRLLMLDHGQIVLDRTGTQKTNTTIPEILSQYQSLSL